jgi:hypothetical protein
VPDREGEAYDEMLRQERLKRDRAERAVAGQPKSSVGHPGFAESLIPVWGSGREAVADFQDGDYVGAALNGGLAASDLFLAGAGGKALIKTIAKAATKAGGKRVLSTTWNATRARMKNEGYIPPGQQGHHWLIPQNGWGKSVPAKIKNAHWNVMPRPAHVHKRIHTRDLIGGKPRFNFAERYLYGTPRTAKVISADAVGHPATALKSRLEEDE